MTANDDIDALAGEYVLGTLDAAERAMVAARRQREPALDAAIRDWERRLAPLDQQTTPVAPPDGLLDGIMGRIGAATPGNVAQLVNWQQRAQRWRMAALAASAAAAALVVWTGVREATFRPQPQQYVGVFAQNDVLPQFYLTIDLKTRELTIRPVDARQQPGKTYQLWILAEQLGPVPQSLGLVDETLAPTRKSLNRFEPAVLQNATFGVSLEQAGGSTTGRPAPGALHARLLPVATH